MQPEPRLVIERLCVERGDDFAGLSRMLGRNPAYIQQFVRRGVPKRLKEAERRKLARYFAISESLLGGPAEDSGPGELMPVKRVAVRALAGPGAVVAAEASRPYFGFDSRWLKSLTATPSGKLSVIRVEGDSMAPTLNSGDDILIDPGGCDERLRDGIYVLRVEGALIVKRVAIHPVGRRVTVQSDNPAYPDWPDCDLEKIACIGRVIWAGRRID